MHLPLPFTRDLVLLGGGHTHALVLQKWAMAPVPGIRLTLVTPEVKAPYTGMLPGLVAGHYATADLEIDLVGLARRSGARLIVDRARTVDIASRHVALEGRPALRYDALSINVGISSSLFGIDGFAEHGRPAKPLAAFAAAFETFVADVRTGQRKPDVVVIGAGVAGVELALAMAHRFRSVPGDAARITLLESGADVLREVSRAARHALLSELDRSGVQILTGVSVSKIERGRVRVSHRSGSVAAQFVVGAAGAHPHAWLASTGLALEQGYVAVGPTLATTTRPEIFAVGDCAHMSWAPRPKAGVFAVRQAPVLYHNLRAVLCGGRSKPYAPQKSYLKLISTGRQSAVADKFGLAFAGPSLWRVKNHLDRTFMARLARPVHMPQPKLPDPVALGVRERVDPNEPHCGACGAKVALEPLLKGLSPGFSPDSGGTGPGLDDAALIPREGGFDVFTTDHLRAFTSDPWLMARVAAIHAMGDIWAMGGQVDRALAHLTLPPMRDEMQASTIAEIMAGARRAFDPCGGRIVGGHTAIGAELSIGFSVIGRVAGDPVTLRGGRAGDALILTKPIGTGILLAAEMRQEADGQDYYQALQSMCRPQHQAAGLLGGVATAMTDVTGFGLAGHLMNLLTESEVSAEIDPAAVPFLGGALGLHARGIRSTLWQANAARAGLMAPGAGPVHGLLADPQTCGGLLASLPAERLQDTMNAFRRQGEPIWHIGGLLPGPPCIVLSEK